MSITEILDFLDADREHMQQGLFLNVEMSYLLQSEISFDMVCSAII